MAAFPTTQWTHILNAQQSPEQKAQAWQNLLSRYWQPLFTFFRARGLSVSDAADAVQSFALSLMEKDVMMKLAPERGRLRGFLCRSADNFLVNEYEKASAQRRGGGQKLVSMDDTLFRLDEPVDASVAPETAFERAWATSVFQRALARLEGEWSEKPNEFKIIQLFFSVTSAPPGYREVAQTHSMSIPQLKSMLHRARLRFRELVQEEVIETVGPDVNVEEEMGHLVSVLSL